jgi:hypothetical protein
MLAASIASIDRHVEQLFEVANRLAAVFAEAGIEYRLVGGMAVYLHVQERDPLAARLTRDIDVAIDRVDLERIADAARSHGFEYRHAAGVDMLVDARQPGARSAVHFVFVREKVRDDYLEAIPDFSEPARSRDGLLVAPVADLVRMKLTSFRLKDQVHVQDLDAVGLITQAVESLLPPELRERLAVVRAAE